MEVILSVFTPLSLSLSLSLPLTHSLICLSIYSPYYLIAVFFFAVASFHIVVDIKPSVDIYSRDGTMIWRTRNEMDTNYRHLFHRYVSCLSMYIHTCIINPAQEAWVTLWGLGNGGLEPACGWLIAGSTPAQTDVASAVVRSLHGFNSSLQTIKNKCILNKKNGRTLWFANVCLTVVRNHLLYKIIRSLCQALLFSSFYLKLKASVRGTW